MPTPRTKTNRAPLVGGCLSPLWGHSRCLNDGPPGGAELDREPRVSQLSGLAETVGHTERDVPYTVTR